ncbi:hypothetical protein BO71DRAFT_394360 [Aspergillus ellipticus CBS 707.79]|uniref:Wax synthase domain-containing protein n=1 Tax=Aspergillus ellipticus CBS 707.79 TaxID=1448320 RepID=A0A319DP94_9EURO|nr:hypothetical protein BO71DRAFT_394360 [Aspergillus ellipticus CBS 707.79]
MGGLVVAWWFVWAATLLVFHDPEREFRRVERRRGEAATNGHAALTTNRPAKPGPETLTWQSYPGPFWHRLNWVLGLLTNMRGPEWNWRVSTLGPFPPSVLSQLDSSDSAQPEQHVTPPKLPADLRCQLPAIISLCLKSYLALDLIKLLMIRDHYFMGLVSSPPDPPFPFDILAPCPFLVQTYRCTMTGIGVLSALAYVSCFNPLLFGGLSLAFPSAARAITSVPLDAGWLYPPAFGPFLTTILDSGLIGCWSQWWHQIFRYGFISTSQWILSLLGNGKSNPPTRSTRRLVTLIVAFSVSGFLHACGSYAQIPDTCPLTGTYRFFISQAGGILLQDLWCRTILPRLVSVDAVPRPLRRAGNAAFALGWLLYTGRWITEDFARGGLWFTEPLPVSLFRGLGVGVAEVDQGWWCWGERWFGHWDDGSFWGRGTRVY